MDGIVTIPRRTVVPITQVDPETKRISQIRPIRTYLWDNPELRKAFRNAQEKERKTKK